MQAHTLVGGFTTAIAAYASTFIAVREAPRRAVVSARELAGGEESIRGTNLTQWKRFVYCEQGSHPPASSYSWSEEKRAMLAA